MFRPRSVFLFNAEHDAACPGYAKSRSGKGRIWRCASVGFPACLAPRVPVYFAPVGTPSGPRRTTEPFAASAKVVFPGT